MPKAAKVSTLPVRVSGRFDYASLTVDVCRQVRDETQFIRGRSMGLTLFNAAWADYNTAIQVSGYSSDGMIPSGGCSCMNVNNHDEVYAFHTGGANALRGDGSVAFIRDSIQPAVLAALVSAAGGEVVGEY